MTAHIEVECRPCVFCGKAAVIEMPIEAAELLRSGASIAQAWPESTMSQRELLISGTDEECWDKFMKDED